MSAPRVEPATDRPVVIANVSRENVSRRQFLQGVSAMGGLVLAAGFSTAAQAADPPKYGADGMPNGWRDDPLVFVADSPRTLGFDGSDGLVGADILSRFIVYLDYAQSRILLEPNGR